ncbi:MULTISPECIES: ATP-binding protein [unclassified Pseudodesulfovibrio]|uniref:Lon protease family protein n=1 Tax=unclassified Pseudodesulfovibrio TaxID=2661612 RepID=UPI000FEBD70C|nr:MULTISPECIES: ATP-binding protein [unclassified Pseudodesulfovibrio]MCJ2166055.1 AAA family ATPase [Pseudodesulfovibrio sp. S3-i]RWU02500.1 ATP-binding protein [Pseudodesulfovibrio sp. S3]
MTKTTPPKGLSGSKLRATLDPTSIPYKTSADIPAKNVYSQLQPRAIQALALALEIKGNEHNVYVSGEPNMGRTYFVKSFLKPEAAKATPPADWVYLYNFEDSDKPIAISLPAGQGRKFKLAQTKAITHVRQEIPAHFEKDTFQKKHELIVKKFNSKREGLFNKMDASAEKENFSLSLDDEGVLTLSPIVDGEVVSDKDFEKLKPTLRKELKAKGEELLAGVSSILRQINQNEMDMRESETALHRETAQAVMKDCFSPVMEKFKSFPGLSDYFEDLVSEVVDNVDQFMPRDNSLAGLMPEGMPTGEDFFTRFEVNLFVDNGKTKGAPVVVEDHPTAFNLLGSIEREAEMGALYTDFTLIKAGSLHEANGGFLILNMEDLLSNPSSWEGLLRALRSNQSRIEDPVDPEQVRARTIQPAPIDLDLKVVLIGTDEHYELLLYNDDRFAKYFKLKAHLQHAAMRTAANIRNYISIIGQTARESKVLPLTREAMAALVDFSSRLVEDQKRLSLYIPLIRERMIEASALARMAGKKVIDQVALNKAVAAKDYRVNLYEEEFMADYDRQVIKVATDGTGIGRANGLSVTLFGDYEFGLPHQISCTVGVGHGGILDLEREAQLGGPIHTKGMMIIKSYLVRLFAQDKPIVLTGSLCFEQSYAGIEGDSASGAELASLLSALSDTPINLSYAFTGAVSQTGAVMAVGGVNRKIEGFFEVCRRRKLTGRQGVILPADNVVNLMLKDEIVQAVDEGKFHIFPVKTIEEAMSILTGMPCGKRGKNGQYPTGTLYRKVDSRLAELAKLAMPGDCQK